MASCAAPPSTADRQLLELIKGNTELDAAQTEALGVMVDRIKQQDKRIAALEAAQQGQQP